MMFGTCQFLMRSLSLPSTQKLRDLAAACSALSDMELLMLRAGLLDRKRLPA